jgi:hypothetical protein
MWNQQKTHFIQTTLRNIASAIEQFDFNKIKVVYYHWLNSAALLRHPDFQDFLSTVRWKICEFRAEGMNPIISQILMNNLHKMHLCEFQLAQPTTRTVSHYSFQDTFCSRTFHKCLDPTFTVCPLHYQQIQKQRQLIRSYLCDEVVEMILSYIFDVYNTLHQQDYCDQSPFLQHYPLKSHSCRINTSLVLEKKNNSL